jgi:hypothetical protein
MYFLGAGAPTGATLDESTGEFSFTPADGPATYTITVSATDNGSPQLSDSTTFSIQVSNVAPVVSLGPKVSLRVGQTLSRTGSFADPGADTWTATVDYGDGTGRFGLALSPDKSFTLKHTYKKIGDFSADVIVTDKDGGSDEQKLAIHVVPKPTVVRSFQPTPKRGPITALTLTFSQAMNARRANSASDYVLVSAGTDQVFGTGDDVRIKWRSVKYDPRTDKTTLTPSGPLALGRRYQLTAKAANLRTDLIDANGTLLDGDANGQPGGNYIVRFGAGTV